ncbi:MAG: ester cyclase [Chloroflexi bacterium]|nr:ester cyclase [Chloroflexota bacterium]
MAAIPQIDRGNTMANDEGQNKELKVSAAPPDDARARITMPNLLDIQFMDEADSALTQPMEGYNPRYKNIVDYIIGVTHEIWEEHGVGKLYDYYANTIVMHTAAGLRFGREAVIAATLESQAGFPDRRLFGEEVIWSGNNVDGFYTSHRLRHEGTNRGWTPYGPPTGKRVSYRAIADCVCVRDMMVEEWISRDELTLVRQMGYDPLQKAKEMVAKEKDSDLQLSLAGDIDHRVGQLPPEPWPEAQSEDFDPEDFVGRMMHEVWNWKLLNKARDYYHENFVFEGPSGRAFKGIGEFQTYALSLLSPFPDLSLQLDHFCHVGDERAGYRVATRWSMRGTHTGYGIYGEPTGNPIRLRGFSHHVIKDGRIANEHTVFDEFVLLKQIVA